MNHFSKRLEGEKIFALDLERKNCFANPEFTWIYRNDKETLFQATVVVNYTFWEMLSCDLYKLHASPTALVLFCVVGILNFVILGTVAYYCENQETSSQR